MFKKLCIFALSFSAFITNQINAVYFYGEVLKKDDVTVVLLGDIHLDKPDQEQTKKQQEDLLKIAKNLNACCIIEDPFSPQAEYLCNTYNKSIAQNFRQFVHNSHHYYSPLIFLVEECKNHTIEAHNCDYREPSSAMTQFKYAYDLAPDYNTKKPLEVIRTIFNEINGSNLFNNSKEFNNLIVLPYQELLKNFEKNGSFNLRIALDLKDNLFNFYTIFKLHRIFENTNKKFFIICTGSWQTFHISPLLKKLNFQEIACQNQSILFQIAAEHWLANDLAINHALNLPEFFDRHVTNPQPKAKL